MKKLTFALLAMVLSGVSSASMYCSGFVSVTATTMQGTMNVRYDGVVDSAYIAARGTANGSVFFYGTDAAGTAFSCYVPTTSAIYPASVDIKNSLKNGSYLYVIKDTGSSQCTLVHLQNNSCRLD
jgi:hypothetical protein